MIKTTEIATTEEVRRILRLMEADPEVRAEVRRAILTEELLQLPERVDRLTERVAMMDARLTDRIDRMAARTHEMDGRLIGMETRLSAQATETETRLSARINEIDHRLSADIFGLGERVIELDGRLSGQMIHILDSQRRTEGRIDQMWNLVGMAVEDAAETSLEALARDKGFTLASPPFAVELDGDGEIDLIASVRLADGRLATVVVEAKFRLRGADISKHSHRLDNPHVRDRLNERGYRAPYLAYAYGEVVYVDAFDEARRLSVGIYGPYGDRFGIEVAERE